MRLDLAQALRGDAADVLELRQLVLEVRVVGLAVIVEGALGLDLRIASGTRQFMYHGHARKHQHTSALTMPVWFQGQACKARRESPLPSRRIGDGSAFTRNTVSPGEQPRGGYTACPQASLSHCCCPPEALASTLAQHSR